MKNGNELLCQLNHIMKILMKIRKIVRVIASNNINIDIVNGGRGNI